MPYAARLVTALTGLTLLLQISYPLVDGHNRDVVTVGAVLAFASASVMHAAVSRGYAWAGGLLIMSAGMGYAAEAVGVASGFPFGRYSYDGSLGPRLLGVPLVIPLAWTMFAYPCLLVGRRLALRRHPGTGRHVVSIAVAALALTSWDVFLDPQMTDEGHWTWQRPFSDTPGIDGIPLTNFAGWLLVAILLMTIAEIVLPDRRAADGSPTVLFLWTYVSSILVAAVLLDRPLVALIGAVAMGLTAIPFAVSVVNDRP